ncbi:MAG: hypothetical protein ACREDR_37770 [Blastocatellia bacterium]
MSRFRAAWDRTRPRVLFPRGPAAGTVGRLGVVATLKVQNALSLVFLPTRSFSNNRLLEYGIR